jgi:hypothetical protein
MKNLCVQLGDVMIHFTLFHSDGLALTWVRRDTSLIYFLLKQDHIMFPALNHNKTQRPRMSLVMPALVQINDTNMGGNTRNTIAFMQIDCEVIDTALIYLKSSDIPINYVKLLLEDYDLMAASTKTTENTKSNK